MYKTLSPGLWEDPKNTTPNSGLSYSYGVDDRALLVGSIFGSFQGSGRQRATRLSMEFAKNATRPDLNENNEVRSRN